VDDARLHPSPLLTEMESHEKMVARTPEEALPESVAQKAEPEVAPTAGEAEEASPEVAPAAEEPHETPPVPARGEEAPEAEAPDEAVEATVPDLSAAAQAGGGQAPDVENILARLDDLYCSKSSFARVEFTVVKPSRTTTMRMRMWTEGEEKALIVVESPARAKGMATLKVGTSLWNYLPNTSRTIRLPPSMMLGSWMGSDFTNDDLVKESSYLKDFTHELAGRSEEPPGWLVRLTVKPGIVGRWERIDWVISDDGTIPVEAKYFDRKGRLARVMKFDEVRAFGARRLPAHMVLTPLDKLDNEKKQWTEMRYVEIQFDADVPQDTFSLSTLERQK